MAVRVLGQSALRIALTGAYLIANIIYIMQFGPPGVLRGCVKARLVALTASGSHTPSDTTSMAHRGKILLFSTRISQALYLFGCANGSSEAMIRLAMINLMVHRLKPG